MKRKTTPFLDKPSAGRQPNRWWFISVFDYAIW
jgi:hypothetical protein